MRSFIWKTILFTINGSYRYSRLDEKRITNKLAFIVMEKFADRSTELYWFKEKQALTKLKINENDFMACNDSAVAYIK